jgi:hypothetical protein
MNIDFRCFLCCITLLALGSVVHGQDMYVSDGDKNGKQSSSAVDTPSNNRPLDPVPEPSTGSLILLGLGGVALAVKLRRMPCACAPAKSSSRRGR